MFTFAVLLAASAALPNYTLPPVRPAKCSGPCASRYRLPTTSDGSDAVKKRALAEDGTDCNITRSKICRRQPRTWVRTTY